MSLKICSNLNNQTRVMGGSQLMLEPYVNSILLVAGFLAVYTLLNLILFPYSLYTAYKLRCYKMLIVAVLSGSQLVFLIPYMIMLWG